MAQNLKLKVLTLITKLSNRDTYKIAAAELEAMPTFLHLLHHHHCNHRHFCSITTLFDSLAYPCMAVGMFAHEVSNLYLRKPAFRSLLVTATVAEALLALKNFDDSFLSIWNCDHIAKRNYGFHKDGGSNENVDECKCIGKLSIVDIICYLCHDNNAVSPSAALKESVSVLLPKIPGLVMHVEPTSRY